MFDLKKVNPFPALFDGAPENGYPASEMGYIRAYYKDGWTGRYFETGEQNDSLVHEISDIYTQFITAFPTRGKMADYCRKENLSEKEWCGYPEWTVYVETPIALYRLVMRNISGDYNLYLHCYDRWRIPYHDPEQIFERTMENYECGDEVFNTEYLDFEVSAKKSDLLAVYANAQKEINGDIVTYPDGQDEKYTGNYKDFILSCVGKEGYERTNEDIDDLQFAI